ncbi:MAG: ABC transporter substrate-binding protein [Phycisphaeraceae bacterium]|nr:ABC transporter substrate-binding protein [Phycisphaeraceae bacterium]
MLSRRWALSIVVAGLGLVAGAGGCEKKSEAPKGPAPAAKTPDSGSKAGTEAPKAGGAAADKAPPSGTGPILIGHYGSLTGSEATFGKSTSEGIRLAIKEFNAAGGLNGRMVEVKEYDTKGDAKEAKLAVERLVKSDGVVAVLGEVASGLSLAGGPVCQEAGVPMISPSSTNPRVTKIGDMIFRVCFIDPFQGFVGAKFARENLKAAKAAMLYDQKAPYSVGLAQEFKKAFEKLGGQVVAEQTYNGGDQDFTAQLTSIRGGKPDVIYVPGYYTDIGNIALQTRKLNISAPLLGGDGWDSEELGKIAGDAIKGSFYSNHYAPDQADAAVKDFIKRYQAEFNGKTPDGLAALGYDAACLLFDAMKRSKSLGGRDLRDAIAATRDFKGVTGSITIDENRDAKKGAVIVEMAGSPLGPKFRAQINP